MGKERFSFGENWSKFSEDINDERMIIAQKSLMEMLRIDNLSGKTFLDVGCGSGLFSLVAKKLGAKVYSFDYDPDAVLCAKKIKECYFPEDDDWFISRGDILDDDFLNSLNKFDFVYAWGVLHHTGNMWCALDNVSSLVSSDGYLFIAIYNDQGLASSLWKKIKKFYNLSPRIIQMVILFFVFIRLYAKTIVSDTLKGNPFLSWEQYKKNRGMSPWIDLVDWAGGYPFEVAKPEDIINFYEKNGFILYNSKINNKGHGCNEFVFQKK